MAPPAELTELRLTANSTVDSPLPVELWERVEDDESLWMEAGDGSLRELVSLSTGEATQRDARFSMTMTEGEVAAWEDLPPSSAWLLIGLSFSSAMGLGVKSWLLRRFLRRFRREADEGFRGSSSSKSSSQAARTAEFCLVSMVISSSATVGSLISRE